MRGVQHPMDRDLVDQDPDQQPEEGDGEQPQVGMHPGVGEEQIDAEHPQGDDRPVGQIDHPHHPPDQGKPHRRQAVDKPQQQAIDQ